MRRRKQEQRLDVAGQIEEYLFLGLRLTAGIGERAFYEAFHLGLEQIYGDVIRKHIAQGLLAWQDGEGGRSLRLTQRGLDLANYVMADFLEPPLP